MKDSYMLYTDKLQGEYSTVFEQVDAYVGTLPVDNGTREERMSELLDMFLSAQEAGKPVKKIVGSNVKEFCKIFCSDFGIKNLLKSIFDALHVIAICLLIFSVVDILCICIDYTQGQVTDFWNTFITTNTSHQFLGLLFGMIFGFAVDIIFRNVMFRLKKVSITVLKAITVLVVLAVCIIFFVFLKPLTCPLWILMSVSLTYLIVYYAFNFKKVLEKKNAGKNN
ncbi:MAG: DUF1048 domain-containing protein [Ruminococcus sp.]|nr:DUF1048 domain-containing protein [Ruminococcus sp.]